jgi:2-aminoadipate transaminase
VPIIEDDPYGFLLYDGEPLPPLSALDADWVFYLGSFSKIISPALRLGWMVVPPEAAITKDAIDLESSGLMQRVVSDYLDGNDLFERIAELRATYRRRRDAMLEALDEFFPSSARWNHPRGGFFVWVELGEKSDTTELLERSWRRRASRSCRARPSRSAVLELLIACD